MLLVIGLLVSCGCTDTNEPPPVKDAKDSTTVPKTPEKTTPTTTTLASSETPKEGYTGYMKQEAGQWAEYNLDTESGAMRQMISYLGVENIEGTSARGYEAQTSVGGREPYTVQLWIDEAMKLVKYAAIEEGSVVCKDTPVNLQGLHAMGSGGTPEQFDPSSKPAVEEYLMPDGRKIMVARYASGDVETMVSSDVPFGLVKAVDRKTGKTVLSLADYGLVGGNRTISSEDLAGCKRMEDLYKQAGELTG